MFLKPELGIPQLEVQIATWEALYHIIFNQILLAIYCITKLQQLAIYGIVNY